VVPAVVAPNVQATSPAVVSTAAAAPTSIAATAVPQATLIPLVLIETPVPVLFGLNANAGANGHATVLIPTSFVFQPGIDRAQILQFSNTGQDAFSFSFQPAVPVGDASTALWTDPVNGLQITIVRDGATLYQGPMKFAVGQPSRVDLGVVMPGDQKSISFTMTLPLTAPNSYQGVTQPLNLTFEVVSPPYASGTARAVPSSTPVVVPSPTP